MQNQPRKSSSLYFLSPFFGAVSDIPNRALKAQKKSGRRWCSSLWSPMVHQACNCTIIIYSTAVENLAVFQNTLLLRACIWPEMISNPFEKSPPFVGPGFCCLVFPPVSRMYRAQKRYTCPLYPWSNLPPSWSYRCIQLFPSPWTWRDFREIGAYRFSTLEKEGNLLFRLLLHFSVICSSYRVELDLDIRVPPTVSQVLDKPFDVFLEKVHMGSVFVEKELDFHVSFEDS